MAEAKKKDVKRTVDPACLEVLTKNEAGGIETAFDRYLNQQPQCKFGETGVCCKVCIQGPCRITSKASKGVCGSTGYTIVARNLVRSAAGGASAHSDHGRHIVLALRHLAEGKAPDYKVMDPEKLRKVAAKVGIEVEGKDEMTLVKELTDLALADFSRMTGEDSVWLKVNSTEGRRKKFKECNIYPSSINGTIVESISQTHMGMDADPVSLIFSTLRNGLADFVGMHIATDLSDILFGTPQPVVSEANLGVIDPECVNLAVHGHNPLLSEMIVRAAREMKGEALQAGAREVKLMGICCTGNEVLMREGVPIVSNFISQELPMMTGAMDAMVVDVQCIMPGIQAVSECFHTEIITTSPIVKIPGANHIDFTEETALAKAKEVVQIAIEAFKKRSGQIDIPQIKNKVVAGFSLEALYDILGKLNPDKPVKVLTDAIEAGELKGVCLFAGCNNLKGIHDENHLHIARELAKNNVFMVATGCAAGGYGKAGLLNGDAVEQYAGDGLKAFIKRLEDANELAEKLPLIFHMGSCVDNTRAADLYIDMADEMGVDIPKVPFVASAPEAMSEKAISIGSWNVAMGLPVHVGVVPPVQGSTLVDGVARLIAHDVYGGFFIWETDAQKAADKLLECLDYRNWKNKVHKDTAEKFGSAVSAAW
jgi:anaerobic carbon-monoxide dehydrogenase catalytic subunit